MSMLIIRGARLQRLYLNLRVPVFSDTRLEFLSVHRCFLSLAPFQHRARTRSARSPDTSRMSVCLCPPLIDRVGYFFTTCTRHRFDGLLLAMIPYSHPWT